MEEMTTGLCPNCGHALQIPAELESFSCMYCGERLTKRQLLTQAAAAQRSDEDCATSYDRAVARLGWCVKNFRGYQKKILRDAFFEAFETYETGCAPVIQELNNGITPERQTELLDQAAEAMLDELSAGWEKKTDMDDEKIILAIFFVPMVRKQQLPISEAKKVNSRSMIQISSVIFSRHSRMTTGTIHGVISATTPMPTACISCLCTFMTKPTAETAR